MVRGMRLVIATMLQSVSNIFYLSAPLAISTARAHPFWHVQPPERCSAPCVHPAASCACGQRVHPAALRHHLLLTRHRALCQGGRSRPALRRLQL
eukprot:2677895-Prymnesium_polylepis.1